MYIITNYQKKTYKFLLNEWCSVLTPKSKLQDGEY